MTAAGRRRWTASCTLTRCRRGPGTVGRPPHEAVAAAAAAAADPDAFGAADAGRARRVGRPRADAAAPRCR